MTKALAVAGLTLLFATVAYPGDNPKETETVRALSLFSSSQRRIVTCGCRQHIRIGTIREGSKETVVVTRSQMKAIVRLTRIASTCIGPQARLCAP